MLLRYFYDEQLAQASYMVGCVATGEALVVDPMRDVEPYLQAAAKEGLRITHVTETHIHADFVSGVRELAARTGAMIYLSDMGDEQWKYAYPEMDRIILVRDGDSWMVGNIKIEVIATPGHTLEHIAFMVTDTAGASEPMGVFTGDFLFVGDIGRPDLLEEAAGFIGTKEPGARMQYKTVARFKELPDYLQIWPAHGAGSACGKALGAIPSTTLGYEKRFNPAFQFKDEDTFVQWLLSGQPEAPRYFARMKHVNKVGPALLSELPVPQPLDRSALDKALDAGALVVDLRDAASYVRGHVPGTLSIPATNKLFTTYIGWYVDYSQPFYFIAPEEVDIDAILIGLRAIGIDTVPGYFTPDIVANAVAQLPTVTVDDLAAHLAAQDATILDVRGLTEYQAIHLPNAIHVPVGLLSRNLDRIPRDRLVIVHCASGYRAQIATTLLRRAGFPHVASLVDPKAHWQDLVTGEVMVA